MSDMGTLRRSPRLWEQQVQARLEGIAAGEGTTSAPILDGLLEGTDPIDPTPPLPSVLPKPSVPKLDKGIGSVIVTWNGLDATGEPYPVTAWVEVHVSLTDNFTPSDATKRGVIPSGGGSSTVDGLQTFSPPRPYYFRLVGRDEQGGTAVGDDIAGFPGQVVATDIGEGSITYDKVSFNARAIGGVTTGIGTQLPPIATVLEPPNGALDGDLFLLKVTNADGRTVGLKQYACDGTKWNPVEWGSAALSAQCITAQQILTGTITAESGVIRSINADVITTGSINADLIKTGTLDANKISATGTISGASLRTPRAPNNSFIEMGNTTNENEDYIKFITGVSRVEGQIRANDNGMTIYAGNSPLRFDKSVAPGSRDKDIVFNSPAGSGNWRIFIDGLPEANFSAPAFDVLAVRNSDGQIFRVPSVTTPEPQIAALEQRIAELESRLAAVERGA